jgi:gamma-butyrobetaine dioxygenase
MDPIDQIAELFASEGAAEYLGEPVTQAEHMLQAASLARDAGATPALVAACLLHDVGHFHGALRGRDLMTGKDNRHDEVGATWLAQWFAKDVTEPVRLHVAAKRYLCRIEPEYLSSLSPASVFTLSVQGGPMSAEEAAAFSRLQYASDALSLRRFDEQAKDPSYSCLELTAFLPLLEGLIRRAN